MNWDAIRAVGEVFSAIAVVASVGYLATQIPKQIKGEDLWLARSCWSFE